jgi:hypothetical protein
MSITIGIRLINLRVNPTARGRVAAREGVEVQLMKEARQILLQKREAKKKYSGVGGPKKSSKGLSQ